MTKLIVPILLLFLSSAAYGQKLMERSGKITFYSEAPIENISATNDQVLAVIDKSSGEVAVTMLMKGFQFRKALMQEHFNESYIESDKFPKATFSGQIQEYSSELLETTGTIVVKGHITLHGVKQPLTTNVKIEPGANVIAAETEFPIRVADHEIKIPSVVSNNIAKVVDVKVQLLLK